MYIAGSVGCGPRGNRVAEEIILVNKQLCHTLTTEDMNKKLKLIIIIIIITPGLLVYIPASI